MFTRLIEFCTTLPGRVHRDQRGTISIVTVFTLLMFTMLLVMLVNVGQHLDEKMQMQNAADASAYSGGVVLARGMNTVAYTNHLLCDTFAVVAFLREGERRAGEPLTTAILDDWELVGQKFSEAQLEKFRTLGSEISAKVPKERQLVQAFGDMNEAAAELSLPAFEAILREEMIPEFQRTMIRTIPIVASEATDEVAYRHGLTRQEMQQIATSRPVENRLGRGRQVGVLWRTRPDTDQDYSQDDPLFRTIPAIDPSPLGNDYMGVPNPGEYLEKATIQRRELSKHYLEEWIRDKMRVFDEHAEMSQYSNLYRILAAAQLERLLAEYADRNLPMIIRDNNTSAEELQDADPTTEQTVINEHLEDHFNFLSVVYRTHLDDMGYRIFRNPLKRNQDAQAYAQVHIFVPRGRAIQVWMRDPDENLGLGGTVGFDGGITLPPQPPANNSGAEPEWVGEGWPTHWDLLNQNWTVKLVPATMRAIPNSLSDYGRGGRLDQFRLPDFNDLSVEQLNRINTH